MATVRARVLEAVGLTRNPLALSPEIRAMVAPFAAYRALASDGARRGWSDALMRPAFVALVIGTSTTICATGRATLGVVLSGTLCWSFVPAVQMLATAAIIGSVTHRPVRLATGIDLFFISHGPWSLSLLTMTAWTLTTGKMVHRSIRFCSPRFLRRSGPR